MPNGLTNPNKSLSDPITGTYIAFVIATGVLGGAFVGVTKYVSEHKFHWSEMDSNALCRAALVGGVRGGITTLLFHLGSIGATGLLEISAFCSDVAVDLGLTIFLDVRLEQLIEPYITCAIAGFLVAPNPFTFLAALDDLKKIKDDLVHDPGIVDISNRITEHYNLTEIETTPSPSLAGIFLYNQSQDRFKNVIYYNEVLQSKVYFFADSPLSGLGVEWMVYNGTEWVRLDGKGLIGTLSGNIEVSSDSWITGNTLLHYAGLAENSPGVVKLSIRYTVYDANMTPIYTYAPYLDNSTMPGFNDDSPTIIELFVEQQGAISINNLPSNSLEIGHSVLFSWDYSGSSGDQVTIDLSRDGGTSWEILSASTPNNGSFNWVVAPPYSTNCRIRVTSNDNAIYTDTSETFAIIQSAAAGLTLSAFPASLSYCGDASTTVTAVQRDASNTPIANEEICFSIVKGQGSLYPSCYHTNSNGEAATLLIPSQTSTIGVKAISNNGASETINIAVGDCSGEMALDFTPRAIGDSSSTFEVEAQLKEQGTGEPINDSPVTFSATLGGVSAGTFDNGTNPAVETTNEYGRATMNLTIQQEGNYRIVASSPLASASMEAYLPVGQPPFVISSHTVTVPHGGGQVQAQWHPTNMELALAVPDNIQVYLYNPLTGELICQAYADSDSVTAVQASFNHDGSQFAFFWRDGKIFLYNTATCTMLKTINVVNDDENSIDLHPFSSFVAFGSHHNEGLHVYNINTGAQVKAESTNDQDIAVKFSPNGAYLAVVAAHDGATPGWLSIYRTTDWSKRWNFPAPDKTDYLSVAWSPDGKRCAVGDNNGNVLIFNIANGTREKTIPLFSNGEINTIAWSPNGHYIAAGSHEKRKIYIVRFNDSQALRQIASRINSLSWSPDSQLLLGGIYEQFQIWAPFDESAPKVTISSPESGIQTIAETITLTGTASDNIGISQVELLVNQSSMGNIAFESNGSFTANANIPIGVNTISVKATDFNGHTTVREIQVVRVTTQKLTIDQLGNGTGTVNINGISHSLPYSGVFAIGSIIQVEAVAASLSRFSEWQGGVSSADGLIYVTLADDLQLQAVFGRLFNLAIAAGTGDGQVKLNGVPHTLPVSTYFMEGETVDLEAVPFNNSPCIAWRGDLSSIQFSQAITISGNTVLSIDFDLTLPAPVLSYAEFECDDNGMVMIDWNFISGATSYHLERATDPLFADATTIYTGPANSYTDSSLANGSYYYRIRSEDQCGLGKYAFGEKIRLESLPASPVSLDQPTQDCDGNYKVSWSPIANADSYELRRYDAHIGGTFHTIYTGKDPQYFESGISNGSYVYFAQAHNVCGESPIYYDNDTTVVLNSNCAPQITGVELYGPTLIINGNQFGSEIGNGFVSFTGAEVTAEILSWSDSEIRCRLPVGASGGCVQVIQNGEESNCYAFPVVALASRSTLPGIAALDAAFHGDYAYVAGGSDTILRVIDLTDPALPREVAVVPESGAFGGSIKILDSYAFVGDPSQGLHVIDISNPLSPAKIGELECGSVNDLTILSNNYLYIVTDTGQLKLIRIANPANPEAISIGGDGDYAIALPGVTQALAIALQEENLYIGTREGVLLYNRGDIQKPRLITQLPTVKAVGDIEIRGQIVFLALNGESESDDGEVQTIDFSNPSNPHLLDTYITPGGGHSITSAGQYLYLTDADGCVVLNAADPSMMFPVGRLDLLTSGPYSSIAASGNTTLMTSANTGLVSFDVTRYRHRPIINGVETNAALLVIHGTDFGSSQGHSEVRLNGVDLTTGILWSDTLISVPLAQSTSTTDKVIIVTENGIATPYPCPEFRLFAEIDSIPSPNTILTMHVTDSWAFLGTGNMTRLVDVHHPDALALSQNIGTNGYYGICQQENVLYLGGFYFHAFDISDPGAPIKLPTNDSSFAFMSAIQVRDDMLYAGSFLSDELNIYNIADISNRVLLNTLPVPGLVVDMQIVGDRLYLLVGGTDSRDYVIVQIYGLDNPSTPQLLGEIQYPSTTTGTNLGFAVHDTYLLAPADTLGLNVIDVSDPATPTIVAHLPAFWGTPEACHFLDVTVAENLAFVSTDYPQGVAVFDLVEPENLAFSGWGQFSDGTHRLAVDGTTLLVTGWDTFSSANISPFVNDPPTILTGTIEPVAADSDVQLSPEQVFDPEGDAISYNWTQTGGQPVALNITNTETLVFTTPFVEINGNILEFLLTVTDSKGAASKATFTVPVTWANRPPVAEATATASVSAAGQVTLDGTGSSDPDDNIISYFWQQIEGQQAILADPNRPTATFTAPYVDTVGEVLRFRLTVTDAQGESASTEVETMVNWVNRPPVAQVAIEHQRVIAGTPVILSGANSYDPDGPINFLWQQLSGPEVDVDGLALDQAPFTAPASGTSLAFRLTVTDAESLTSTAYCTVSVNQQPFATNLELATSEDTPLTFTLLGSDPDDDPLFYTVIEQPQQGQLSGTPPLLSYMPAADFSGDDSFTFTTNDGLEESSAATVHLQVTTVNDPPHAMGDSYSVLQGESLRIEAPGILANDTDTEGSLLSAVLDTSTRYGSLSLHPDGSFLYQHNGGEVGIDSFNYFAHDGEVASVTPTTVNINILAPLQGDINGDQAVDLTDAILALQLLNNSANQELVAAADFDGDGKIGWAEVIYALQQSATGAL